MTDATLPPRDPGPEPDTTTAAESEHVDDSLDREDAPPIVEETGEDAHELPPP